MPFSTFILKQDPKKPSAHIEATNNNTRVHYEGNTGIFIILVTFLTEYD